MPTRDPETPSLSAPRVEIQIGPAHVVASLLLVALFLVANLLPLYYSDLWGHVAYGQWIIRHGQLPAEDPFVPLVAGERIIDSAWLSQVVLGAIESAGGAEWISHTYAACVFAIAAILGLTFQLRSRLPWVAAAGMLLVVVMGWFRLAVIRPETFGMLCFAVLLLSIAVFQRNPQRPEDYSYSRQWRLAVAVAVTMALWANCHGSFAVGIVLLAVLFGSRICEVAWQQRSVHALFVDREARSWLLCVLVATGATLLNPYGWRLLINTLTFGRNPNLEDMTEWAPLEWGQLQSNALIFCWLLFLIVAVPNWRRLRVADVLLMLVFSVLFVDMIRMGFWFFVVFSYTQASLIGRLSKARIDQEATGEGHEAQLEGKVKQSRGFALVCLLILGCGFALSPLRRSVTGSPGRAPEKLFAPGTPLEVTNFLRQNPPTGQIYNPVWWGDWLAWQGPPGLMVLTTTNTVHVASNELWRDYVSIARLESGWQSKLDKYAITTIVSDKVRMSGLSTAIRSLTGYKVVYEDDLAIVVSKEEMSPNSSN